MPETIQTPPDLETDTLLKVFLELDNDEHYRFLLPAGESVAILQRVRVTLSRKRKIARLQGIRIKEFRLKSEVTSYPSINRKTPSGFERIFVDGLPKAILEHQLEGTGFDLTQPLELVDVWRYRTTTGKLTEIFDDLKRD